MAKRSSGNEIVTKEYLKQELSKLVGSKEFNNFKKEFNNYKNRIMGMLDKVMKELVTIRQEQSAHFLQHERIDEKIGDHEKRITKIESHQFA